MIDISIPGWGQLHIEHLVLDYNGTLAIDGHMISGVKNLLEKLGESLQIHVLTADTFGSVESQLEGISQQLFIIPGDNQAETKLNYVKELGIDKTVCVGNGRNDALMLKSAALGIAVLQAEGMAVELLEAADVICPDIQAALNLLANPLRLIATLRI